MQLLLTLVGCSVFATPHAVSTAQQASKSWLRAEAFVSRLTNAEKANLTTGIGTGSQCAGNSGEIARFNMPSLCLDDGPAGVRATDGASGFPAQINTAATWDVDLIYRAANALGEEFRGKGVNVAFAPLAGGTLGRSPYAGRIWEGFGVDPYLNGIASYWAVKGIQDAGVIATPKHFVAYEQETLRWTGFFNSIVAAQGIVPPSNDTNTEQMDSVVSNRTLREVYLWPFEEMMRARPLALMCSYNRINGEDACSNKEILDIAKNEWNFEGFIVSDYGAAFMAGSTTRLVNSGLDMDMPGGEGLFGTQLDSLVRSGNITQGRLDEMATRVMYSYFESGQDFNYPKVNFANSYETVGSSANFIEKHVDVRADHHEVIREIGTASAILLKNTPGKGLPLRRGQRIAIFGSDAGPRPAGRIIGTGAYPANSTNNGTTATSFGSGTAQFPYLIDPLAAITYSAAENQWQVSAILEDYSPGTMNNVDTAISRADACLVFVAAATGGETRDRETLKLDNRGDQYIKYVADRCANTIVVAHIEGPTNLEVPANHPNVTAIVNAGLPGEESGRSLVPILEGSVSPSGKLVYTILQNDADYIQVSRNYSNDPKAFFTENLLIDYRRADALDLPVRYEFGFGLSYTNFTYSAIDVSSVNTTMIDSLDRADTVFRVTATLQNTGHIRGAEVSQLYLGFPASAGEPLKVLRGFTKSFLDAGASQLVHFDIRKKDLSIWDELLNTWRVPVGEFAFMVGGSSRNLALHMTRSI